MADKGDGKTGSKLILGRDSDSWMRILGFYFTFYAFLAAIFIAFVAVFSSKCPDDSPYLHGRALQTPGLAYMPNLEYSKYSDWVAGQHRDIDPSTAFVYKNGTKEQYDQYADKVKTFFDQDPEIDYSHLGDCEKYPYGFDTGKPCLFFKLNRIIDWEPLGVLPTDIIDFFNPNNDQILSQESFCTGKPEFCASNRTEIDEMLKTIDFETLDMTSTKPIVRCLQYPAVDSETVKVPLTYFPTSGKIDFTEPYQNKENSTYVNPVVGIQFDLTNAMDRPHRFYCFAFDRNIELNYKTMSSGVIAFYLQLNS